MLGSNTYDILILFFPTFTSSPCFLFLPLFFLPQVRVSRLIRRSEDFTINRGPSRPDFRRQRWIFNEQSFLLGRKRARLRCLEDLNLGVRCIGRSGMPSAIAACLAFSKFIRGSSFKIVKILKQNIRLAEENVCSLLIDV